MQINCEIRGDLPDAGSRCSFFSTLPVTLEKIKFLFPYEGKFQFRMQVSGDKIGMPKYDYVWMDLVDLKNEIQCDNNNVVNLRAVFLEDNTNAVTTTPQSYSEYLVDINDEIPKIRQPSHNISISNAEDTDNNTSSIGKVFNNLAQGVKQVAPININTVKAGASSLWKAVKATASHIQHVALSDGSGLSSQAADNLADLSNKLSTPFSDSNPQHVLLLERLFEITFPGENYERESLIWKQAGWQKTDPVLDLKTSGVLALQAMICLGETYPERTQRMLINNRANTKNNYPFAIVGINLTLMLAELFFLKDNKYLAASLNFGELFREYMAFFEVFNICFNHIDNLWTHRQAVRADFGKIIGEVKILLTHILQRGPRSIEEFKLIGADEGITILEMHHGKDSEQVPFGGNGIKLLDLKKEILDRKKINRSLDFDLNIVDENGKVYNDDDEFVPKNASVVVKRIPANQKNSLLTRLNNRTNNTAVFQQKSAVDIVLPMKVETEVVLPTPSAALPLETVEPNTDHSTDSQQDNDVLDFMQEGETVLIRTAPVGNTSWGGVTGMDVNNAAMSGLDAANGRYRNQQRGGGGIPVVNPSAGYPCTRCKKLGHNMKFCPTIGDPAFDPEIKLSNIPKASHKRVANLEGIDTSNKTVIENSDGTFVIFESNSDGLNKLGESHLSADHNLAEVPDHLKCALSGAFLREAVCMPCCKKCVNDSVIRTALVASGLTCPLCSTQHISPDSLIIRNDLREAVEDFLRKGKQQQQSAVQPSVVMPSYVQPQLMPPHAIQYPYADPMMAAAYGHPGAIMHGRPPMAGMPGGGFVPPYYHHQQQPPLVNPSLVPHAMPLPATYPEPSGAPPAFVADPALVPPAVQGGVTATAAVINDDIPPLEVLPLPMTIHEFLQEQEFQRQERVYLEQLWFQNYGHGMHGGGGRYPPHFGGRGGGYQGRGRGGGRSFHWRENNRDDRDYPYREREDYPKPKFNNLHYTGKGSGDNVNDSVSSKDKDVTDRGSRGSGSDNKFDNKYSKSVKDVTTTDDKSYYSSKDKDRSRDSSSREQSDRHSERRSSSRRSPSPPTDRSSKRKKSPERDDTDRKSSRKTHRSSPARDSERSTSRRSPDGRKESTSSGNCRRDKDLDVSRSTSSRHESSRDVKKESSHRDDKTKSSSGRDVRREDTAAVVSPRDSDNSSGKRKLDESRDRTELKDASRSKDASRGDDSSRRAAADSNKETDRAKSDRKADTSTSRGSDRREGDSSKNKSSRDADRRDEKGVDKKVLSVFDRLGGGPEGTDALDKLKPLKSSRSAGISPEVSKRKGDNGGSSSRVVYSDEQATSGSGRRERGGGGSDSHHRDKKERR